MEVTVSTSRGRQVLALDPSWTVAQLKQELHSRLAALNVPEPSLQKLVCATKGYAELDAQDGGSGAPLSSFFSSGDCLVVIPRRDVAAAVAAAAAPLQTTPAPTTAEINDAIELENQRLAALGAPPPPPMPPRPASRPAGFRMVGEDFQQLRGYLDQLRDAMEVQGLDPEDAMMAIPGLIEGLAGIAGGMGGGMGGGGEEEDEEDEEGDEEGGGEPAAPQPVVIPEPEAAALTELLAMGFPDQLSRNALLLHRNRLQPAVDWALSHVDDPSAAEPLSEARLQEIYARPSGAAAARAPRRRLPAGQVDAAALDAMVEMGFSRDASARALAVTRNRLEAACQLVLSGAHLPPVPEGAMPGAAAPAGGNGDGAAAAGGAAQGGGEGAEGNGPPAAAAAPAPAVEGMAVDAADVAAAVAAAMAGEHASSGSDSSDESDDGDGSSSEDDADADGSGDDGDGWHTDNGSDEMEHSDGDDDEDDDEDPEGADVDNMDHEGGAFFPLGMMGGAGGGGGDPADLEFVAAGQYVPEEMYSDYSDEYEEEGDEEGSGDEEEEQGGQGPQE